MMKLVESLFLGLMLAGAPVAALAQAAAPAPASVQTPAQAAPVLPAPVLATPANPTPANPITVTPDVEPLPGPPTVDGSAPMGPAAAPAPSAPSSLPVIAPSTDGYGYPDGRTGLQPQVTDVGRDAAFFHDVWLVPIIAAVTLLVLALLLWVIVRYRRSANPVPSRTSHNTTIEVIWTVLPVALLVAIAFPSLGLLARQYAPPKADLTVKAIGNQWYWTYQYPDHGGFELVSNMLKEVGDPSLTPGQRTRTAADGPRLLAVDDRLVVPVNATVKVIVTSADVLHSFAMPAFWQKMDAVPGRLNETWFKADREGVYFGQCSELCGARHAYMPIAIEVVSPARFAAWVATKGGSMPGAGAPAGPDSTAASPITNPSSGNAAAPGTEIGPGDALETTIAPSNVLDVVEKPAVSTQGATDSARSNQN